MIASNSHNITIAIPTVQKAIDMNLELRMQNVELVLKVR